MCERGMLLSHVHPVTCSFQELSLQRCGFVPELQYRDVTMDFVRLSIKTQLSLSPLPVHFLPSLSADRSVLCVLFIPDLFLLPQA